MRSAAAAIPRALDADLDELAGRRPSAAAALARAMHHRPPPRPPGPTPALEQLCNAGLPAAMRARLALCDELRHCAEMADEAAREAADALQEGRRAHARTFVEIADVYLDELVHLIDDARRSA